MNSYISLIGLGAVGAPLADLLFSKYKDDFILLSSKSFLQSLNNLYMNGNSFEPKVISTKSQLKKPIGIVFICVKNYQIEEVGNLLSKLINEDTIIVPLQNGIYSFEYFKNKFPRNVVLEGFAQGPNTQVKNNIFVYQKPGLLHIGSSSLNYKEKALQTVELLKRANVNCFYSDDIKRQIWKKLMLNVAGNAITALTEIDYCMFPNSNEVQTLCRKVMKEFISVANAVGVQLGEEDIEEIMKYFLSFKVSKKTSMLEDVLNKRQTENEFIAGYISKLSRKYSLFTPHIDTLYELVKIKEEVYLGKI